MMKDYFDGNKLFGDDFSEEEIVKWYEAEAEGYANLGSNNEGNYYYGYHELNKIHGFSKLNGLDFKNVLGIGSAWGHEFDPIISRISSITILEPSDQLRSKSIGNINPKYVKPNVNGSMEFGDNTFDLITCFGTLHHIPNVSFVLGELIRVLKPNGHLLFREPIVSMGDWRKPRRGLTKNERGIPVSIFDSILGKYPITIISKGYCFTATSGFQAIWGKIFKTPIYANRWYIISDKIISSVLKRNVHYQANNIIQKIAPSSIFYVVQKQ